jgi:flagellar basal body-associated protein FliL
MKTNGDSVSPTLLLKRVLYWRMAFFSVIILLAGVAIGASGTFMWFSKQKPKPAPPQTVTINKAVRRLNSQLKLTKSQTDQVRPLVRKCLVSLEQVRKKARPQINQHLRQMNQGIASVLNDNQMRRWKKYEKQLMALLQENRVRLQSSGKPRSQQAQPSPKPLSDRSRQKPTQ